jgi:hypothetical protein
MAIVMGGTAVAAACGDSSGPDLTTPASLTLIPSQATIDALNATLVMTAAARDALGNDLPDVELAWQTSNNSVVSVDAAGTLTSVALGSAEITVTAGELTRTSEITVVQTPTILEKVSGDQQSATVGTDAAEPLVIQVNDRNDQPVAGVEVMFEVTAGTGALSVDAATSGADGRVSTQLTLGTAATTYEVTASLETGRANRSVFTATGLADAPTAAAAAAGDAQRQPAGSTLPNPLRVQVTDQYGNGVPGFSIVFTVESGEGVIDPTSVDTGDDGHANAVWTLGGTIGPQTVSADAAGLDGSPITFGAEGTDLAISGISPSPFVEGGPAQIMGTGFDNDLGSNTVTVAGFAATVTSASSTLLEIEVPRGGCQPQGPVAVVVSTPQGGTTPGFAHALQPSPIVNVGVGGKIVLDDPNLLCLQFLATGADEEYLLGVQSTSDVAGSLTEITMTSVAAPGPAPMPFVSAATSPAVGTGRQLSHTPRMQRWDRHRDAEVAFRLAAREALRGRVTGRRPGLDALALVDSTVTVGQTVNVRMADIAGNICTQSVPVTAEVKAVGLRGIWLADQDNPNNGFTNADYQSLSDQLDDLIYDKDVEYFGEPTDIDDNARILILVTEKLNERSNNTLGFVSPADLFDQTECPASNEAEIYYNRAPDPLSGYGREEAMEDAPELIAHEFTHIIQSGRRIVNNGISQMALFLSEGQATFAEEIVGHAATGRSVGQNYGFTVAFESNPTPWYEDGMLDIANYFGRNQGSPGMSVTGAPARCSWTASNPSPCQGRALWYGVTWSFLRWISDHFGPTYTGGEQGIHRALIDNDVFGFENIEDVVGESIGSLLADWAAALYLDDQVAGVPARLTIPSWNYQNIFADGALGASAALSPAPVPFGGFEIETRVRAASTSYFLISGMRSAQSIRVRDQADGILPDHIQVFLVRTR